MRLLDTTTLQLSEFIEGKVPEYAILSHTWADGEVLFRDLEGDPSTRAGWTKIQSACRLARDRGHAWVWIDTCCIDKSSSSELSEAINSMFRWYQDAQICFAYLADVPYAEPGTAECAASLAGSRWFTRGWTLQELLAPASLDFYSSDWRRIDSRSELGQVVGKITGIDAVYLKDGDGKSTSAASVAERMSWASKRQTTRVEDEAYCLIGLFDVNMPLIYGEGHKAFRRLQEVILREIDDQSLFAWGDVVEGNADVPRSQQRHPLFAEHPRWFAGSGDIVPFRVPGLETRLRIGHNGVTVTTPLWRRTPSKWVGGRGQVFLAPLQCQQKNNPLNGIALCLRSTADKGPYTDPIQPAAASYFRLSGSLLTAPKTAWKEGDLCSAFIYFTSEQRRHLIADEIDAPAGCVIRTLPAGCKMTTMYSRAWGRSETTPVIPFTSNLSKSYGLGCPVVVVLERPSGEDLALVLQFQYLSLDNHTSPVARFPRDPEWMLNRVVGMPRGRTVEDVADVVREESETWPADHVRRASNGEGWGGAGETSCLDLWGRSRLETDTEHRVTVSNEDVHGPLLFIVDVERVGGENVSSEVHHHGHFTPVGASGG